MPSARTSSSPKLSRTPRQERADQPGRRRGGAPEQAREAPHEPPQGEALGAPQGGGDRSGGRRVPLERLRGPGSPSGGHREIRRGENPQDRRPARDRREQVLPRPGRQGKVHRGEGDVPLPGEGGRTPYEDPA